MRRALLLSVMVCVAATTMACADKESTPNPVGPSSPTNPTTAPAAPSQFPILLVNCSEEYYGPGYRCRAEYWTSHTEQQGRDVTGFSTWSTSDTTIATVDSTGFVTVVRAGNVAIRAVYRDLEGFALLNAVVRSPTR
jgi:hypothetical protein